MHLFNQSIMCHYITDFVNVRQGSGELGTMFDQVIITYTCSGLNKIYTVYEKHSDSCGRYSVSVVSRLYHALV